MGRGNYTIYDINKAKRRGFLVGIGISTAVMLIGIFLLVTLTPMTQGPIIQEDVETWRLSFEMTNNDAGHMHIEGDLGYWSEQSFPYTEYMSVTVTERLNRQFIIHEDVFENGITWVRTSDEVTITKASLEANSMTAFIQLYQNNVTITLERGFTDWVTGEWYSEWERLPTPT